MSWRGDEPSEQVPGLEVKVSVPQIKICVAKIVSGPRPIFGVETDIRKRPFSTPLPVCEYSITPLLPLTNKGASAILIFGSRSQSVLPEVRH